MKVELTREDLINLIKGSTPNYGAMDNEIVKRCGNYSASYGRWDWDYDFEEIITDITEEQLWQTYILCRDSFE